MTEETTETDPEETETDPEEKVEIDLEERVEIEERVEVTEEVTDREDPEKMVKPPNPNKLQKETCQNMSTVLNNKQSD